MKKKYTSVERQVEYGLNTIDKDRTVKVSLRDLLYIHNALGEMVRFFHNPSHYETLDDVEKFMGTKRAGALHVIWESYYKRMNKMLPHDIHERFADGDFDHPNPPYYYKP